MAVTLLLPYRDGIPLAADSRLTLDLTEIADAMDREHVYDLLSSKFKVKKPDGIRRVYEYDKKINDVSKNAVVVRAAMITRHRHEGLQVRGAEGGASRGVGQRREGLRAKNRR